VPPYVRGYGTPENVLRAHLAFDSAIQAARAANALARQQRRRLPALGIEAQLEATYAQFRRDLDNAARVGAVAAQKAMRESLQASAVRPVTDKRRHLRDLLVARPVRTPGISLPTGEVGIADVARLDLAVDPDFPDQTYWRAQEEGTSKHVGRRIFGYFIGGGVGPDRPRAAYSGVPGPHSAFAPTGGAGSSTFLGPRGGRGGKGTIRHPIKPRHFIRDGAAAGYSTWAAEMRTTQSRALQELTRILR
jgi:hypothetical protein